MAKSKFLVATYAKKPRDPKRTHLKGFGDEDTNYQFDEQLTFTVRLKDKDILEGHVILDLLTAEVVKNRGGNKDFQELFNHFYGAYGPQIDEFIKN